VAAAVVVAEVAVAEVAVVGVAVVPPDRVANPGVRDMAMSGTRGGGEEAANSPRRLRGRVQT
jgi:hypothetical protein